MEQITDALTYAVTIANIKPDEVLVFEAVSGLRSAFVWMRCRKRPSYDDRGDISPSYALMSQYYTINVGLLDDVEVGGHVVCMKCSTRVHDH